MEDYTQGIAQPIDIDSITGIAKKRNNRICVKTWNKTRTVTTILFSSFLLITLWTFATMDYGNIVLSEAIPQFFADIRRIFLQPRLSGRFDFVSLLYPLKTTVGLAVISTVAGAIFSFFFGLLAARNLSPMQVSTAVRVFMSFIRAVPSILWVLIFSLVVGLGAEAAVIGLVFHGVAFLTKAYSESIEELDEGVIEALKATGATWWQIVFQAVLPSSLTTLLSWTFIRFEINFGNAVAVGAAAGAGGLGFQLALSSTFHFDLHEVGVIVYMILVVAVILELISMKLRAKYLLKH